MQILIQRQEWNVIIWSLFTFSIVHVQFTVRKSSFLIMIRKPECLACLHRINMATLFFCKNLGHIYSLTLTPRLRGTLRYSGSFHSFLCRGHCHLSISWIFSLKTNLTGSRSETVPRSELGWSVISRFSRDPALLDYIKSAITNLIWYTYLPSSRHGISLITWLWSICPHLAIPNHLGV